MKKHATNEPAPAPAARRTAGAGNTAQLQAGPGHAMHDASAAASVLQRNQQRAGAVPQAMQLKQRAQMMAASPPAIAMRALQSHMGPQAGSGSHSSLTGSTPLQRYADVYAEVRDNGASVKVDAAGTVGEFSDGDGAADYGWNNVHKYHARMYIGDNEVRTGTLNNDYIEAQAGHVLAQQNGGLGSDGDNVFAQDGGINNGTFRTVFENPVRAELNAADDDEAVSFRAVLYAEKDEDDDIVAPITKGPLVKKSAYVYASEEDTDGTTGDEMSESGNSSENDSGD